MALYIRLTFSKASLAKIHKYLVHMHSAAVHVHPVTNLYDSVDGTCLLAEAAVYALGHVDVVTCRPPTSVFTRLSFDRDRLATTQTITVRRHSLATTQTTTIRRHSLATTQTTTVRIVST